MQGKKPIITWQGEGDKRRAKLLAAALQDVLTAWNREMYSGQVDSETNLVWLAASKILRETREIPKMCEWKKDRDGIYETGCGNSFDFFDGGPIENHFKFCPYCGLSLGPPKDEWPQTRTAYDNAIYLMCPCGRQYTGSLVCPDCGTAPNIDARHGYCGDDK